MSNDVNPAWFARQISAIDHLLSNIKLVNSNCPKGVRVSVVSYNANTKSLIRFQDHKRNETLLQALRRISLERTGSGRFLGAAMRFVGQNMFKRVRFGLSMRKVAVFFANGMVQDPEEVLSGIIEFQSLNILPVFISQRNVDVLRRAVTVAFISSPPLCGRSSCYYTHQMLHFLPVTSLASFSFSGLESDGTFTLA